MGPIPMMGVGDTYHVSPDGFEGRAIPSERVFLHFEVDRIWCKWKMSLARQPLKSTLRYIPGGPNRANLTS